MESSLKPNWAELPRDLLATVMDKLTLIDDYVRFGAVCVSWRTLLIEENPRKKLLCSPPFLLTPQEENNNRQTRILYNITRKKVYDFQLPVPGNLYLRGSCFGWLVTMESVKGERFSYVIQLRNPFLSNNNIIDLPSLMKSRKGILNSVPLISKAVLSANPSFTPNNYVILAIAYFEQNLVFFKPGMKAWSKVHTEERIGFMDVVFNEKANQFFVVDSFGAVFTIDIVQGESEDPFLGVRQIAPPTTSIVQHTLAYRVCMRKYLVEVSSGELLLVHKIRDYFNKSKTKCEILKLDPVGRGWIQLQSLEGSTLFLGNNSPICVSETDVLRHGCKPNYVYFADDCAHEVVLSRFTPQTEEWGWIWLEPTLQGFD